MTAKNLAILRDLKAYWHILREKSSFFNFASSYFSCNRKEVIGGSRTEATDNKAKFN